MAKTTLPIHVGLKVCFSPSVCRLCLISPTNPGSVPKFNFYLSRDWDSIDTCLLSFNLFSRILDGWGYRMVYHSWPLPVYLYDTYISHNSRVLPLKWKFTDHVYVYLFYKHTNFSSGKKRYSTQNPFSHDIWCNLVMSCLGRKFQYVNCSLNTYPKHNPCIHSPGVNIAFIVQNSTYNISTFRQFHACLNIYW